MRSTGELISAPATTDLGERLGHPFDDPELFERALTHRSWCAEHPGAESNERLEFLGDAVLGLVVADHVFREHPELPEGWLSRARASVVRSSTLAAVAGELGVGEVLRLGKGEEQSGGREKPSILADALEALIGAVYLDGGPVAARDLVVRLLADRIDRLPQGLGPTVDPAVHDYKSRLQEHLARESGLVPEYACDESGPEHEKLFRAVVLVSGAVLGAGEGRSKKSAEQEAARHAFDALAAAGDGAAASSAVTTD